MGQVLSLSRIFGKLKQILAPKSVSIHHCIFDGMGNEITDPENVRNQFQTEFLYRLRQREPKEHETCGKVQRKDFSESELESVIRSLKNGKSRDTVGFIRKIFK